MAVLDGNLVQKDARRDANSAVHTDDTVGPTPLELASDSKIVLRLESAIKANDRVQQDIYSLQHRMSDAKKLIIQDNQRQITLRQIN
jgi:hypothetical protein